MRRIAFFGGSFDPPHRGHLAIALAAAERFALDQVLFAPVGCQPLKNHTATPFVHRYAMTALATQADARFIPSLLDAPAERPNYTVETLGRLRSSLGAGTRICTLLGIDSWLDIASWHDASRLVSMSDWIVAARPGFSLDRATEALPPGTHGEWIGDSLELTHLGGAKSCVFFLPEVQEEISATQLRAELGAEEASLEWLPKPVWDYIRKANLFFYNDIQRNTIAIAKRVEHI